MANLTKLQQQVINELISADCDRIAATCQQQWGAGRKYYIDDRVSISKALKARFIKANNQVK